MDVRLATLFGSLLLFGIPTSWAQGDPASKSAPPSSRFLVQSYPEESQGIEAVCFSPNGKWALSGGRDGLVRVYSVERGKLFKILGEHSGWVRALAFSRDGKFLASGSSDKTVKIWDAIVWKPLTTIQDHERAVTSLAFSPDGSLLVSGSDDRIVRVWDPVLGKKIKALKKHDDEVRSVGFSPDGRFLISGSADFKAKIWDAEEWKEVAELGGIPDVVESAAFSPDGRLVAAAWSGGVGLWATKSGKHLRTIRTGKDLKTLSFAPGSSYFAAGGDRTIRLINGETGAEVRSFEGHSEAVQSVAFSPAGRLLASGGLDATLRVWEALHVYVIESSAALRNAAGEPLLQLAQGTDVQILDAKDASFYVQVKENLKGWVSKSALSFDKPDLRAPFAKILEAAVFDSSMAVRGVAYDDNKVQSVFMGEHFFARIPVETPKHLGDAFAFDGTVEKPQWAEPALKVVDQFGREFTLPVSTSIPPLDFKPRYGSLWVQESAPIKSAPDRDSVTVSTANPGEVLNSIGHKGEWYLLEDRTWVHWMPVVDRLAASGDEKE